MAREGVDVAVKRWATTATEGGAEHACINDQLHDASAAANASSSSSVRSSSNESIDVSTGAAASSSAEKSRGNNPVPCGVSVEELAGSRMRQPYPPKMGHDGRAMDAELAGERGNGLTIYAFLDQLVDLNWGQSTPLLGLRCRPIASNWPGQDHRQQLHDSTEVVRGVRKPSPKVHSLLSVPERCLDELIVLVA